MKRKPALKQEQIAATALAVAAYGLIKQAKRVKFTKRYLITASELSALSKAVSNIDPHVRRWVRKHRTQNPNPRAPDRDGRAK